MERVDLAINALLAYPTRDQLSVLRAKIEDEDEFVLQRVISYWPRAVIRS